MSVYTKLSRRWWCIKRYGFKWLFKSTKVVHRKHYNWHYEKQRRKKVGNGFLSSRRGIKRKLIARDGAICQWCHKKGNMDTLSIDHIKPIRDGGTNDLSNLRLMHIDCHSYQNHLYQTGILK